MDSCKNTTSGDMVYAPVLIPTLCRDEHLIRCIESLKRNTWAKYTDVYVAVDYPLNEKHWEGYRRVCAYLDGDFPEFASFHVIKRQENYGSSRNMGQLRAEILEKYDRFIRTDDDVEFSPNFLEYMDKTLMYFEDDDDVVAVTGYTFPCGWEASAGSTVIKERIVAPMWGTGFWKKKYVPLVAYITNGGLIDAFSDPIKRRRGKEMSRTCQCEYINAYTSADPYKSVLTRVTDVSMRMYLGLENKFFAAPVESKARNWGNDGSGVSCPKIDSHGDTSLTYRYCAQPIDSKQEFQLCVSEDSFHPENLRRFDDFDKRGLKQRLKPAIRMAMLRLLGRKLYTRIVCRAKGK